MGAEGHKQVSEGVKASVRYRVRSKMEMTVIDIAEGGCMVDARGWGAKEDERVQVTLPGLSAIPAVVAWIEEGRAGIAFEEPLYGPVLERFFA